VGRWIDRVSSRRGLLPHHKVEEERIKVTSRYVRVYMM
jgi:hypothetical protein